MPPEPSSPSGLPSRCGRVCEQDVHSGALTKIQGTFGAAMSVFYISRQQQGDSKGSSETPQRPECAPFFL